MERREKKRSTFFCTRKIIKTLGNDLFILRMTMHAAIYWQYRLVSRRMACGTRVWWEQSCFRSFLARLEKRSCSSRTGTLSSAAICTCSVVDYCMHNKFQFDFTLYLISNINNGRRARRCAISTDRCWCLLSLNLCNYQASRSLEIGMTGMKIGQ